MSREIAYLLPLLPLILALLAVFAWLRWAVAQRGQDKAQYNAHFALFTEALWHQFRVFGADGNGDELRGCTKDQLEDALTQGWLESTRAMLAKRDDANNK